MKIASGKYLENPTDLAVEVSEVFEKKPTRKEVADFMCDKFGFEKDAYVSNDFVDTLDSVMNELDFLYDEEIESSKQYVVKISSVSLDGTGSWDNARVRYYKGGRFDSKEPQYLSKERAEEIADDLKHDEQLRPGFGNEKHKVEVEEIESSNKVIKSAEIPQSMINYRIADAIRMYSSPRGLTRGDVEGYYEGDVTPGECTDIIDKFVKKLVRLGDLIEHYDVDETEGLDSIYKDALTYAKVHLTNNAYTDLVEDVFAPIRRNYPVYSSCKVLKSSIGVECIGQSEDGYYKIWKDKENGTYELAIDGKVDRTVKMAHPTVESILDKWVNLFDIKMNKEYLNSARKSKGLTNRQKKLIRDIVTEQFEMGHTENDWNECKGMFEEEGGFEGVESEAADFYFEVLETRDFEDEFDDDEPPIPGETMESDINDAADWYKESQIKGYMYEHEDSTEEDAKKALGIRSARTPEPLDEAAAHELALYAENECDLYFGSTAAVIKNLKRKSEKGIYDAEKAVDAWMYVADEAASKYDKEFGSGRGSMAMFPKATRRRAAEMLAEYYAESVDSIESEFFKTGSECVIEVLEKGRWEPVSLANVPEGWNLSGKAKVFKSKEEAEKSALMRRLKDAGYSAAKGNLKVSLQ